MLNRRCIYTIYASSRICSKQHSKMPKLFFVPLPKTSDLSYPSNYRPISPLPVIPKSLERHIHKHLLQYLNNDKLIHQYQSGFRPDHSCHTALTRLCGSRMSAINCSEIVGAVFFHSLEKLLILWITLFYLRSYHSSKDSSSLTFFSFLSYKQDTICFSLQRVNVKGTGEIWGSSRFCAWATPLLHIHQ